jgi:4-hydroxythreonine-4-phosphate dehydrogenase
MNKDPIIIVSGEPYSIFLEIFFKSLKKYKSSKPIVLISSKDLLIKQMKKLGFNYKLNLIEKIFLNSKKLNNKKINLINVNFKSNKTFDKISDHSNSYIANSFDAAFKIIKKNKISGLINGPISKKNFLKEKFLGITEYLAHKERKKGKVAMLIYEKTLSVSPITTHLPLKDVAKKINKTKIINQVKLINNFYWDKFKKKPKIAITGLNPHCESNYKSNEEKKIILPAIKLLLKNRIDIKGPYSADTIFMSDNSKKFDVIVGMYHDQVLAPAKTLFGFDAINITLGLPYIRISPDHGPNEKMVGKNLSNPQSLIQAIKFLNQH